MLEFFNYVIPWYAWAVPSGAALAIGFIVLARYVGFKPALYTIGAVAVALVSNLVYLRGKQTGWSDRAAKENRDAENLAERARRARDRVDDPSRLRDDDGYRRD